MPHYQNSLTASKTRTGTHVSKDDSAGGELFHSRKVIDTQNSSKKLLLQSYDDGKPFYQQVGMK